MGYRILILGIRVTVGKFSDVDSENCFSLMTAKVYQHFKRIPDVVVGLGDRLADLDMIDGSWDLVLFIGYSSEGVAVRKRTPKGRMLSLLECPFYEADWSFCFLETNQAHATTILAPVPKDMLVNVPKKKSIIIDHWWRPLGEGQKDWTLEISDWVAGLKGEYEIFRMTRFGEEEIATLKPHEIHIPHMPYQQYLDITKTAETLICTHTESYGYGVIDMVARGIRVATFAGALNNDLIRLFQLPMFKNRDELLDLIRSPVEPRWNEMVNKCADYSDVVKTIDVKCRSMLGKTK